MYSLLTVCLHSNKNTVTFPLKHPPSNFHQLTQADTKDHKKKVFQILNVDTVQYVCNVHDVVICLYCLTLP
jgi:hypothetical protein